MERLTAGTERMRTLRPPERCDLTATTAERDMAMVVLGQLNEPFDNGTRSADYLQSEPNQL
jgi:hypothetical protein